MITMGVVCNDQEYLDKIKHILNSNYKDIKVYIYNSIFNIGKESDFLLLDIDISNEDRIKYAKEHQDIKIVFITNYDNKYRYAYGSNIYSYISKHDIKGEFIDKIKEMLEIVKNDYLVTFKIQNIDLDLKMNDIIYFQYIGDRTVSMIYRNKIIEIKNTSFSKVMNKLDDRFIEITRGTAINKKQIKQVDKKGRYVYLKNINCKFEVSVRKRTLLKKILLKKILIL